MLDKIFNFEACAYDFFIVEGFGAFFLTDSIFLLDRGATDGFVVGGGETTVDSVVIVGFEIVDFLFKFTELDIELDDFDS